MDLETIKYATGEGVVRVTLDRPDRLNAISPGRLEDLDRACGRSRVIRRCGWSR